jgi:hypothetical protein
LLLAAPSVPRATLTPACSSQVTGQMPLASFRFEWGQCTTCTRLPARRAMSSWSAWVTCTACSRGDSRPISPSTSIQLRPPAPGLGHLGGGFVQVDVHRRIQFLGVHENLLEVARLDAVGGVRAESDPHERMAAVGVVQGHALVQSVVGAALQALAKAMMGKGHLAAHARRAGRVGGHLGKEVHVGEAGGAGADHLGDGQVDAVAHELRIDEALLEGPDVLVEPLGQRSILGVTAQEAHRRIREILPVNIEDELRSPISTTR